MSEFIAAVASGDKRVALEALRDMLAEAMDDLHNTLKVNEGVCRKCGGSLSEAGLASLAQRLTQTIDSLDGLSDPAKQSPLDLIRGDRDVRAGVAGSADHPPADLGTRRAQRRQGGRRPSGGGGPTS